MMKFSIPALFIVLFSLGFITLQAQSDTTKNGPMRYFYPNGKVSSEGTLKDGKAEGYWKTYAENGKLKSEGNRKNYQLDSLWKFYNENGELILEINYKAGKKNGLKKTYREGELTTENFVNDVKSGPTTYYYPDGKTKMVVFFVAGQEQGFAREYDKKGDVITLIEYKKGYIISKENINRYDKEGRKQGNWKSFWENYNIKSEGTYRNGLKNGYFKDYDQAGKLLKLSKYADDVLQEDAEEVVKIDDRTDYYPSGKVKTTAGFRNNLPEGIRREFDENGKIVKGFVYHKGIKIAEGITDAAGLRQGPWKEFYENGSLKSEGNYIDGKTTGSWKYYFRNGKTEMAGSFNKAGKPEGDWKWYYDDGSIRKEESFRNGLSDGLMTEYDESGKIIAQGEYVDGNEQGKWTYQMGDYKEEGNYQDGQRDGLWKSWYSDGTLQFEGKFVEDVPDGKHIYYWENGNKKDEGYYTMGKKQAEWVKYEMDGTIFLIISYKDGLEKRYDGMKIMPEYTDDE
jgi:antitoxin component YwqK of YwqJK toxin-antitoxin module